MNHHSKTIKPPSPTSIKGIDQPDLVELDEKARTFEKFDTLASLEFGKLIYQLTEEKDEEGKYGFQRLGFESRNEYYKTFHIQRATVFKKKRLYILWWKYLSKIPLDIICEIGWTKLLTVAPYIIKAGDDPEKLQAIIDEATSLFRHQLEGKYRKGPRNVVFKNPLVKSIDRWKATIEVSMKDIVHNLGDISTASLYKYLCRNMYALIGKIKTEDGDDHVEPKSLPGYH